MDGSYVRAHQHSSGAAGTEEAGIGTSRGGNTSKIHLATDGHGLPIHFEITGGQVSDLCVAPRLIERMRSEMVIADKGCDSGSIRAQIEDAGAIPVIPRRKSCKIGSDGMDWHLYKCRHLVENAFARLKHFRAIATRYDRLKRNFEASVALGCIVMWLPM